MAEQNSWEMIQAELEAEARRWAVDFEKSKEYKKLKEEAILWVYPVLPGFSTIAVGERNKSLSELDGDTVAWVLLEGMPREFVVDVTALKWAVDIMEQFFQYAQRVGLLSKENDILEQIKEVAPLARRRMIDPTLWKPHKAVIIEALQENVDLNDRKMMEKFYKKYQAKRAGVFAETIVADKKVGRNDPCSCDSGKKYKKCCGASH